LLLSRRQFLQLTGIAILSTTIDLPSLPAPLAAHGRTLTAAQVRPRPDYNAVATRHLWPDTVLPITEHSGAWYRTSEGYVERTHIQPIVLADFPPSSQAMPQSPFWAEVVAPVTTIREWCAADAPLITRVGHGGVMRIIDQLPGNPMWYGVANEHGNPLGWTQAPGWQPVHLSDTQMQLEIAIDQQRQQMSVTSGGVPLVRAAVSTGRPIAPGSYSATRGDVAGIRQSDYYGASWPLFFGDSGIITGVYWHNQFGAPNPGPAVQVPVYLARWLYDTCADGSIVSVF
jgi:hypothetical protein